MEKQPSDKESSSLFNGKLLAGALKAIKNKDFTTLANHPLANLKLVRKRHNNAPNKVDNVSVGLTLYSILLEAIDSIKRDGSDGDEPDNGDETVYHTILQERFVKGSSTNYLADFLALSRRQYFRMQNNALTRLGAVLRQWEYENLEAQGDPETDDGLSWDAIWQAGDAISQSFVESAKDKYDPNLYFQRQTLLRHFQDFLVSDKDVFVITGNSGAGKSSFMASLPTAFVANDSLLFVMYNAVGLRVDESPLARLCRDLNHFLDFAAVDEADLLNKLDQVVGGANRHVVLVIDAINEHAEGSQLLYRIDQMASSLRYPWLKVVVSSRTEAWKALKRPLTLATDRYYRNDQTDRLWYEQSELSFRLTRFQHQDLAQVYEKYRQKYALQSAYANLNLSIRNAIRDPLLLRLVSEIYAQKQMPTRIRVIDIYPEYVNALIASGRLKDEDIIFLEQEIVPLMVSDGVYANKIDEDQIRSSPTTSGEPLWKFVVAAEPVGWGIYSNDAFTRLVDAGILKFVDKIISFKYERFYDYYAGQRLFNQINRTHDKKVEAYEALAETAHAKVFLSEPLILAISLEIEADNVPLILKLAQMDSPFLRGKVIAALAEYGLDNREKVEDILLQLLQKGRSRRKNAARVYEWLWDLFNRDAVAATCSATDFVIISVAARLQFVELVEVMLTDLSPAVRAVAIKQTFILWRRDKDIVFAILNNLTAKITRGWRRPRPNILEAVIGLSFAILFDAYDDAESIAKLRELWKKIIDKLLYINVRRSGLRPEPFKTVFRTLILQTMIGFTIRTAGESPDDTVLDIPELRMFFKRDGNRKKRRETARRLCELMDAEETAVSDLHQLSLNLVQERDLFTAILAQTAWRRHVLANQSEAITLLKEIFDKAIEIDPPGPFSNMIVTFSIPLEEDFATVDGCETLRDIYLTINERTQGRWWYQKKEQRWPGFLFLNMAVNGKSKAMPLCDDVQRIMNELIAKRDFEYIHWVISEELRNALVELGYYRYGFDILTLFVNTPSVMSKPPIRQAIVDLLSRIYVYEPELVENFLEVNHLVNDMSRAVKTNIPAETIGDLMNYRAAMFWFEVVMNHTNTDAWRSFIWFFNQVSESSSLENWLVVFFKFIVNEIYEKPIFADVPMTNLVRNHLDL